MSTSSAITGNTAQLLASGVFNADATPIYNGSWTFKNASNVTSPKIVKR